MTENTSKCYPKSHYAKVIGEYCYRAMEKVRGRCEKEVNRLYAKYPYDGFAEKKLHQLLKHKHIYEGQGYYADCVSAGMLAYMYSIHRCADMGYTNVEGYIAKICGFTLFVRSLSIRTPKTSARKMVFVKSG